MFTQAIHPLFGRGRFARRAYTVDVGRGVLRSIRPAKIIFGGYSYVLLSESPVLFLLLRLWLRRKREHEPPRDPARLP